MLLASATLCVVESTCQEAKAALRALEGTEGTILSISAHFPALQHFTDKCACT